MIEPLVMSAEKAIELHKRVSSFVKEGMKLFEIDAFMKSNIADLKCKSAFFLYSRNGLKFPSQACYSVNNCIVHGMAASYEPPLQAGDVLKIDIGVSFGGKITDVAWTYAIKNQTDLSKKLMDCGKESIQRGIKAIKPNGKIFYYAKAVQEYVESQGLSIVDNIGGHAVGKNLHEPPFIPNKINVTREQEQLFKPNKVYAVEPMISTGKSFVFSMPKSWPIYTGDGSLSCHYEHNILVLENSVINLTEKLHELPDIVG